MIFENKQEAFNYWNDRTIQECELRATQLKGVIDTDPEADLTSINIEISGLKEAIDNLKEKEQKQTQAQEETPNASESRSLNPVALLSMQAQMPTDNLIGTAEYRTAFFKKLMGKSLTPSEENVFTRAQAEFREAGFNSSSNSGAVIPTQTLNEIVRKAHDEGGLMSVARAFNIPSYVSVPIGTPHSKASWHTEGETVEAEQAEVTNVVFNGYEIIKIFAISNKVRTMSIPAFESYLTEELAKCVMATIADSMVNGTGENQGTGLLSGIEWDESNSVKTAKDIAYKDIAKTVSLLKRGYASGACWIMNNRTLYNQIYALVDGNKRPVFIMDPKNETIGKILGFTVVVDDYMPDGKIIFGNPAYMGYNMPGGITVDSSTESSYRQGLIDYRAMAVADCKPIVDEAFVMLETTNLESIDNGIPIMVAKG